MDSCKRGSFIVLEGCDRSGKTTQCRLIVEKLNSLNIPANLFHYPKRTTWTGSLINAYLTKRLPLEDEQIHLLFAINRRESIEEINGCLKSGLTLIVDRYSYSGIAYSAIKKGMDLMFCKATELGLPKPDSIIFLDSSIEVQKSREAFGDEIYEKEDIQTNVYQFFKEYFFNDMKVVNVKGSIEEVNGALMPLVLDIINQSKDDVSKFNYENLNVTKSEKFEELISSMDNIISCVENNAPGETFSDLILNKVDEALAKYHS